MALRMGVQLGIFTLISQNPECGASSPEIAEKSSASLALVGKIGISEASVSIWVVDIYTAPHY